MNRQIIVPAISLSKAPSKPPKTIFKRYSKWKLISLITNIDSKLHNFESINYQILILDHQIPKFHS